MINIDFVKITGPIKPMHSVNNGPVVTKTDQSRGNEKYWAEAGIPYVRNHDASFSSEYGGPHIVDVHVIFPDFDADVNDPDSYDFLLTDIYTESILKYGSRVFYRLGSRIEHEPRKYGTLPPKDYVKWAEICEHIILHYNEGWANGYRCNIEYWEIWNEPDLDAENANNKRNWGGTDAEFYRFYRTAALYLKKKFPNLKIGGPALAFNYWGWLDGFMQVMTSGERVPIDFFSWHKYAHEVHELTDMAVNIRKKLDAYGYRETKSILNEWNYISDWSSGFIDSIRTIISMKGAAFQAACMLASQQCDSIDMLMYYDARPSIFNGLFDYYTQQPLKGYYSIKMFNMLYRLGNSCYAVSDDPEIFVSAASGENGASAVMVAYYTDSDNAVSKSIKFKLKNGKSKYKIYRLDENRNCEFSGTVPADGTVDLEPCTVVLLESV